MKRITAIGALALALTGCASWKTFAYEGWGRDGWQQPDKVIAALDIESGDTVADIGAGAGYFTFPLAAAVGPKGVVYAIDIDPDMLGSLRDEVRERGVANVEVVEATAADPALPASGVDLLFTCNTYHHLDDPPAYFRNARRYLRPGARVAIIDLNRTSWFSRWFGHSTSAEKLRSDMTAAGYTVVAEPSFLEEQSFFIFAPEDASDAGVAP